MLNLSFCLGAKVVVYYPDRSAETKNAEKKRNISQMDLATAYGDVNFHEWA